MLEEWLLAGAKDAPARARIRHLLDQPPAIDPLRVASPGAGSPPRPRRGTGISLADAQRMARDAEEWDRSQGAG